VVWVAGLLVAIVFLSWRWKDAAGKRYQEHGGMTGEPGTGYEAPKKNIWADLDENGFEDVLTFLYDVPNGLNLTRVGEAGP
jgi:hypothetical protein